MNRSTIVRSEDGAWIRPPLKRVHVLTTDFLNVEAMNRMSDAAHSLTRVVEPGDVDVERVRFGELDGMSPAPGDVPRLVAAAPLGTDVYGDDIERYRLSMWKRFDYLTSRGAAFHNDSEGGWSNCLFWVLALSVDDVEFVVPDLGLRLPLQRGQLIVFDPHLVHGVCRPKDEGRMVAAHFAGEDSHQAFLSGELDLTESDWARLGCGWRPTDSPELASAVDLTDITVNTRTGRYKQAGHRRAS